MSHSKMLGALAAGVLVAAGALAAPAAASDDPVSVAGKLCLAGGGEFDTGDFVFSCLDYGPPGAVGSEAKPGGLTKAFIRQCARAGGDLDLSVFNTNPDGTGDYYCAADDFPT